MVTEGSVDVTTLVVLLTQFGVLVDERLLSEGGCPCRDGRRTTGVGKADRGDLTDEGILCCRQNEPEVAVLTPAAGTLDRRRIHSEETVCVSDGHIVRFPWLIGEGWVWEAVGDGVDQLGVGHLVLSLVADC